MRRRRVLHTFRSPCKEGLVLKPADRVYVGKDAREEVTYIIGRIGFEELTASAKAELPSTISKIVANREQWFVHFFNTARAITLVCMLLS